MDSVDSPESTSGRIAWTCCFFCSFPITTSSSSKQNEEGSGGNQSFDNPQTIHSERDDDEVSRKDILKYLLSGCKDKELKDNLTSPKFQLELCEICEGRAAGIQDLHFQLKTIQMKLTEKINEVKRIIMGNSGGARSHHQPFACFLTFLREEEEKTQGRIPLTSPETLQHPVEVESCQKAEHFEDEANKIEKLQSLVKEEVEVDEADDYDDEWAEADIVQGHIDTLTISNLVKERTPKPQQHSTCPNSEDAALHSPLDELPRHVDESPHGSDLQHTYSLRKRLRNHREFHRKEDHRCEKCVEVFPSNSELKAHNATVHLQTRLLSCNLCSERFSGRNDLVSHKMSVHNLFASDVKMRKVREVVVRKKKSKSVGNMGAKEKGHGKKKRKPHIYNCKLCPRHFSSWDYRLNHLIKDHGHPKLKCELCPPSPGTFFNTRPPLLTHRKRHHPAEGEEEDNFPCSKCSKQFRTKLGKDQHEKIHVTTKDFSCDQCGFATKTKNSLTSHMQRMHAAAKNFCCEICGYSTTVNAYLALHMKNHNPQFECSECGKRFARQTNLNEHMYSHESKGTFQCDVCQQLFKRKSGLRRHKQKQHGMSGKKEGSSK